MDKRKAGTRKYEGEGLFPYMIMLVFVVIAFMAVGCSEPEKGKSFQLQGEGDKAGS